MPSTGFPSTLLSDRPRRAVAEQKERQMIRKTHLLLALALVAAAVAAPVAQSGGYPIGRDMTSSEIASWTTGACSHPVKAVSCYRMLEPKTVDPLAVSYLIGQGLTPSEVTAWTTGICSHAVKDAACFAMFRPAVTVSTQSAGSSGFRWDDAGVGAGFVAGVLLLGGAGAALLISRQHRRREAAHA
jgi:hypothetical protein